MSVVDLMYLISHSTIMRFSFDFRDLYKDYKLS